MHAACYDDFVHACMHMFIYVLLRSCPSCCMHARYCYCMHGVVLFKYLILYVACMGLFCCMPVVLLMHTCCCCFMCCMHGLVLSHACIMFFDAYRL